MSGYPIIMTRDYDTTKFYEVGQEVAIYKGRFVPKCDISALEPRSAAVVVKLPHTTSALLTLMLVDSDWKDGNYLGYQLSFDICHALSTKKNAKVLIVNHATLAFIKTQLAHAFMPTTRLEATSAGMLYGLKVYESEENIKDFIIY